MFLIYLQKELSQIIEKQSLQEETTQDLEKKMTKIKSSRVAVEKNISSNDAVIDKLKYNLFHFN